MYCSDKQASCQPACKMPKCKKECVKTFTTQYKLYRTCCYKLYKVCNRCSHEFDYYRYHTCPHCGMGMMGHMGSMGPMMGMGKPSYYDDMEEMDD